ncbi:MAG: CAP domain-containing protein [Dehalococcoidia bacterium]|nr:CAP domain-containing protein [Dehalococcoidia bacterium]
MSRLPATAVLRLACWCVCLLAVALAGNVTPGAAEPRAVASSVFAPPLEAFDHLLWPTSTPEAALAVALSPAPSPAPTGTPSPTPSPTPVPEPTPTPSPTPTPPPPRPRVYADPAAAAAVYALTNALRSDTGLPPLARNSALDSAAGRYAASLAENDWFAHEGPDGSTLRSRAEAAGYSGWRYLSENLYRGFYGDAAERIVQAWAASPGHYSNMLGEQITEIGVGCYISGDLRWCVQDFGDR